MIAPAPTARGSIAGTGGLEFFPVSHVSTFQGVSSTSASTYRDYDIAMRNNMTNARVMREDCSLMECLEARQRAVALLNWHIEPEDEHSQEQKDLAAEMRKILDRTPRFTEFRRSLLEAIWYGKSAIQMHFTRTLVNGWMRTAVCRADDNPDSLAWTPIHGDKLVFRNDDMSKINVEHGQYPFQLGIRIGASWAGRLPKGYQPERISTKFRAESIDRGMAYFLDKEDRHRLIVHKHMIEDGAYEDLLSAGSIHGVGVRSRIYWDWVQKQEVQAMLMAYIERTHGGIEIYRYPMGNPEAKTEALKAINGRVPGRSALLVPVPAGEDAFQYGVEVIEPGMAGVSVLQDLLGSFFGHRIKRYILGQTLSTEADATGLGSGVADLHLESFLQIVQYDATNLEETITEEMLKRLQHNNFPSSRGIHLKFKIDTQDADTQKKLEALEAAWRMNANIPEREVFDAVGISPATDSDRILPGPSGGGQGGPSPFPPAGQPHGAAVSVPEQIAADAQPEQFGASGEPERYAYAAREPDLRSAIAKAAGDTDTEPSEAQKISGNYRKGQFHWNGWTVAIENPAGSIRSGRNSLGVEWSHKMPVHYGYFRRTESDADGDHLDVFIGPDPESPVVFVVDQVKGNSKFDEHKAMIGFLSEKEAIDAYRGSYSKGWNGLKNITAMTVEQFRCWLEDGDTGSPIAGQVSRYSQREFNWNEAEHPRNDKGEFVEKGGETGKEPEEPARDKKGPAGLTVREAIEATGATGKKLSHKNAVQATYLYTGTTSSDWKAVKVEQMKSVDDGNGKERMVPQFVFPSGYTQIETPWSSDSAGDPCCHLCGTAIKNAYHIQNDQTKNTMLVGSECVTQFGEGDNGHQAAKKSIAAANREFVSQLQEATNSLRKIGMYEQQEVRHGMHTGRTIRQWSTHTANGKAAKQLYDRIVNAMKHTTGEDIRTGERPFVIPSTDRVIANWRKAKGEEAAAALQAFSDYMANIGQK